MDLSGVLEDTHVAQRGMVVILYDIDFGCL